MENFSKFTLSVVFFLHTKNILKRDNCFDKIYYFVYDNIAKRGRLMQISIGRLWSLCPVLSFKFTILPPNSYGLTVNFCRSFVTVSSLKWKCYEHFRKHVTNLLLMNFALIGHQHLWIELNCANFRCFEQRSAYQILVLTYSALHKDWQTYSCANDRYFEQRSLIRFCC